MSLTILDRPYGYILGDPQTGVIDNVSGDARVAIIGPSTGDHIYIKSTVSNYNGFWYAFVSAGNVFIRKYASAGNEDYIVNASGTFYTTTQHKWSCVHLPIIYKISNDKYPANSVDTSRTVSSISNDSNYVKLNLSGAITLDRYDTVIISGAADDEVNGVWTVLYDNSTDITVNIPYDSGLDFTGASVVRWYNNYNVVVEIWAGTSFTDKPVRLLDTLYLVPDKNNQVIFSINEVLKSDMTLRNNLLLSSMPVNIDAYTTFYIKTAEQYDIANVSTLGSLTSDSSNFTGYATNAKLPFKNIYAGNMSEYYMNTVVPGKFLTLFDQPTVFNGYYFDISMINGAGSQFAIKMLYYLDGVLVTTVSSLYSSVEAIYRIPIDVSCSYDRVDITAYNSLQVSDLSTFVNVAGANIDWTTGSAPTATIPAVAQTDLLRGEYSFFAGTYTFDYNVTLAAFSSVTFSVYFYYDNTLIYTKNISLSAGVNSGSFTQAIGSDVNNIRFGAVNLSAGDRTVIINSFLNNNAETAISETKTLSIACECEPYSLYITWMNYLGGFDYWNFVSKKKYQVDISGNQTSKKNIIENWPNSYGETADTIQYEVKRDSQNVIIVYASNLSIEQAQAISYIKTSPLVQILVSEYDKRTIIIDTDSFMIYDQADKLHAIQFKATYTDSIPSQTT